LLPAGAGGFSITHLMPPGDPRARRRGAGHS
jgi:hypothetical protein